jgi:hypothetical protein
VVLGGRCRPWPSDSAEKLLQDLVVRGAGAGISGGAAPAPGSLSIVGPGVSGLFLSGSPGSSSPPINWRRVKYEAESACLHVAAAERLLHEMLASVHQNILRLVLPFLHLSHP